MFLFFIDRAIFRNEWKSRFIEGVDKLSNVDIFLKRTSLRFMSIDMLVDT